MNYVISIVLISIFSLLGSCQPSSSNIKFVRDIKEALDQCSKEKSRLRILFALNDIMRDVTLENIVGRRLSDIISDEDDAHSNENESNAEHHETQGDEDEDDEDDEDEERKSKNLPIAGPQDEIHDALKQIRFHNPKESEAQPVEREEPLESKPVSEDDLIRNHLVIDGHDFQPIGVISRPEIPEPHNNQSRVVNLHSVSGHQIRPEVLRQWRDVENNALKADPDMLVINRSINTHRQDKNKSSKVSSGDDDSDKKSPTNNATAINSIAILPSTTTPGKNSKNESDNVTELADHLKQPHEKRVSVDMRRVENLKNDLEEGEASEDESELEGNLINEEADNSADHQRLHHADDENDKELNQELKEEMDSENDPHETKELVDDMDEHQDQTDSTLEQEAEHLEHKTEEDIPSLECVDVPNEVDSLHAEEEKIKALRKKEIGNQLHHLKDEMEHEVVKRLKT